MKNLKKVLALVVVFAMMMSTLAFAAGFPDVAADADYANAINVLSDLGFFTGDDKGNFNPDATITRAEYAVVVCRIMGLNAAGVSEFADVAADHWATGYVNAASQAGIIKGYGNGNFGPSDPVKYEEAVTMLVRALGYEPLAIAKGNWPQGHINVASSYGLLTAVDGSVGEGAKRSAVAVMTYNALDIPVVEQTGFGTDVQYTIMKKAEGQDKVTLLTKLDIYKLGGYVAADEKTTVTPAELGDEADFGEIGFHVTDDYDCPEKYLSFDEDLAEDNVTTFRDAAKLTDGQIAKNAIIYVQKYAKNNYDVVAFELGDVAETLVLDIAEFEPAKSTFAGTAPVVKYYKEGSSKLGEVKLVGDYDIILNGTKLGVDDDDAATSEKEAIVALIEAGNLVGTAEFINLGTDRKFDIIDITTYIHVIVEEVDAKNGYIDTYNDIRIDLDIENDEAMVTVKDVNGNDVDFATLKEYDVLALVVSPSPILGGNAADPDDYTSLDIITLGQSKVEGIIKGQGETATGDPVYTIGGTKYEYEASPVEGDDDINWKEGNTNIGVVDVDVVGSEGTFFLGLNGKIVGFEGSKAIDGNYAFIIGAYGTRASNATITLLTDAGIKTFTYAEKVKFINSNTTAESRVSVKDAANGVTSLAATEWNEIFSTGDAIYTVLAGEFDDEITDIKAEVIAAKTAELEDEGLEGDDLEDAIDEYIEEGFAADYAAEKVAQTKLRLIQYNTNAAGEISEILPMVTGVANNTIAQPVKTNKEYKESKQTLDGKLLADDIAIFDIDFEDLTLSSIKGLSYLADESEYAHVLYNRNDDRQYEAMVVVDSESAYAVGAPLAIVKDVEFGKNDDTSSDYAAVTVLVNGEEKVITVDAEETKDAYLDDFAFGTVILYNADAEGLVNSYAVVGNTTIAKNDEGNWTAAFSFVRDFETAAETDYNVDAETYEEDDAYFFGYFVGKNTKSLDICVTDAIANGYAGDQQLTEDETISYLPLLGYSDAKLYQFSTGRKPVVEIGNGVSGLTKCDDEDDTIKNYVLVRTVDGAIQEVIGFDIDVPVAE